MTYLLALDQGTSSSRSIVFDREGHVVAMAQREFPQIYPRPGWVEHDPRDLWNTQLETAREVLTAAETRHRAVSEQFAADDVDRTAMLGADLELILARGHEAAALRKVQMELGALENALQRPLEPGVRAFASPEVGVTR